MEQEIYQHEEDYQHQEIYSLNECLFSVCVNQELGVLAAGGKTENIVIINLDNNKIIQRLVRTNTKNKPIIDLIFAKDNRLFQFGYDSFIVIYYYYNEQFIKPKVINTPNIKLHRYAVLLEELNQVASIDKEEQYINLIDLTTETIEKIITFEPGILITQTLNSTTNLLTVTGESGIYFYNIQNFHCKFTLNRIQTYITAISHNGNLIAHSDILASIRSLNCKKRIRKFNGDQLFAAMKMQFTKNDKYIIFAGSDSKLKIYNVALGSIEIFEYHKQVIYSLHICDDIGSILYTSGKDGLIVKWTKNS